jgi:hypothetical protein
VRRLDPPAEVRWPVGHEPAGAGVHVVNHTTSTAATDAVWAWLVRPDTWGSFYSNARRVRPRSGPWPEIAAGSVFTWTTFNARVTTTITEFEPFERLAWTGGGLGAVGHHAWLLATRPDGGTTISTEETQRGRVVDVMRPLLRRRMATMHQRWVEGLAQRAETGERP